MGRPVLVSGARVVVYISSNKMGMLSEFEWNSTTGRKRADGIDVPFSLELMPTRVGVSGSIRMYRKIADGGAQRAGIVVPQNLISREKYFTIVLVERETDTVIFSADMCSATSESWIVKSRSLVEGVVTFEGVSWFNEASR